MTCRLFGLIPLALAFGLLIPWQAQPQEQPSFEAQQGIEVLTRGPVHEAFAEPVESRPQPSITVPKQPPEPIQEVPPDQKPEGEDVVWIPGYWSRDDTNKDFIWVSGFWRVPPPGQPGYPATGKRWKEAGSGSPATGPRRISRK
jgi:hypothetical protein